MKRTTVCFQRVVAAALVAFGAVCGYAQDLKSYQGIYEKNLASLMTEQKAQSRLLTDKYLNTLKVLQEKSQKAGDLDLLLALTGETGRVTKGERITDENEPDAKFAEFKSVRDQFLSAVRVKDGEAARKIADLTQKYEKLLAGLQTDLTRRGLIDDATAAKNEREALEAREEVAWSRKILAEAAPAADSTSGSVTSGMAAAKKDRYLVIDLSQGKDAKSYPVSMLADVPRGGWNDKYKTDKLVLRKIEPGTFVMGSPKDEAGHQDNETQHKVTLTKAFYIGVFEVTQKQWERVMGDWPSYYKNANDRDSRPVEQVSYENVRGSSADFNWPVTDLVSANSFMGRLRARTGKAFDLPTEAQWEYACRAGTSAAFNQSKSPSRTDIWANMSKGKRSSSADGGGNTQTGALNVASVKAGNELPNAWGLYNMHSKVWEWCLDWYADYSETVRDPKGATASPQRLRVFRGGVASEDAVGCRASARSNSAPDYLGGNIGFRTACLQP